MITDSKWIKAPVSLGARCPTFCRSFTLNGKVERATLRISAIGVYEARINGVSVSRDLFMPGWTSYAHRVQYQEYDLTDKLLSWSNPNMVSLSLPSLRADSFTRELMDKVASIRNSTITFAPEAGSQRLRDVINKNLLEEDLML